MRTYPQPIAKMFTEVDAVIAQMNDALRCCAVMYPETKVAAREVAAERNDSANERGTSAILR